MPVCEVCGNDYDKAFQVTMGADTHTFDSFECAIHALRRPAPTAACGSRGTAWRRTAPSTAASTARSRKA